MKELLIKQILMVLKVLSVEELKIILQTAADIRDYGKSKNE